MNLSADDILLDEAFIQQCRVVTDAVALQIETRLDGFVRKARKAVAPAI